MRTLMLLAMLVIGLWSAPSHATTVAFFDMPTHVAESDAVVEAEVLGAEVHLDPETGRPWTFTTMHVLDVLHGQAPEQIVVRQPGGLAPDGRMHAVAGDARFEQGERVVLFVSQVEGAWSLVLWGWSVWHVDGEGEDAPVWRDQAGLLVMQPTPEGMKPIDYTPDAYVETVADLRDAVRTAGGGR